MLKDFLLVIIGAVCSAIGGFAAIWYQAKKARQIRMEEIRGEQGLEACKKALSLTDSIQTLLIQGVSDDVLKVLYDNGEWFSMNQILLPHIFVENWRSIRIAIKHLKLREKNLETVKNESKHVKICEEIEYLDNFIQNLTDEAEKSLREELKLPEVKIKKWKTNVT